MLLGVGQMIINFACTIISTYLFQFLWLAVLITDTVKISISVTNILADLIIGTPLIDSAMQATCTYDIKLHSGDDPAMVCSTNSCHIVNNLDCSMERMDI